MSFRPKIGSLLIITAITLFWVVMGILMFQREFSGPGTSRMPLSTEAVIRKILEYPEMTELTVYQGERILGYIRLNPKLQTGANSHPDSIYHCLFSMELKIPILTRTHDLSASFRMDFDRQTRLKSFEGRGRSAGIQFMARGSGVDHLVHVRYGAGEPDEMDSITVPFRFDGDLSGNEEMLPPEYRQMAREYTGKTTVTAYSTKTRIGEELLPVYVIESKMDGSNLLKVWITRFGQVYKIETPYGFEVRAAEVL
ncbi:hypothetical protein QQ054_21855 [Oscillatoria amoena NRMC-F 0135]|nr:hypothetical protein [Oscillatoria laete-virens]MDL5048661.1 hypothetical protein [Oscillatoria amoena NRMC-F 0135]MDL5053246.1 hypothetical protein [Oscillatoria laete-virens NRMC-F 0139]